MFSQSEAHRVWIIRPGTVELLRPRIPRSSLELHLPTPISALESRSLVIPGCCPMPFRMVGDSDDGRSSDTCTTFRLHMSRSAPFRLSCSHIPPSTDAWGEDFRGTCSWRSIHYLLFPLRALHSLIWKRTSVKYDSSVAVRS
jgi:hypothetical protein